MIHRLLLLRSLHLYGKHLSAFSPDHGLHFSADGRHEGNFGMIFVYEKCLSSFHLFSLLDHHLGHYAGEIVGLEGIQSSGLQTDFGLFSLSLEVDVQTFSQLNDIYHKLKLLNDD